MSRAISREEAISILSEAFLPKLTLEERHEFLHIAQQEDWSLIPQWDELSGDLKQEFKALKTISNPGDSRYDPILKIWLSNNYYGARNEFLLEELKMFDFDFYDLIEGEPEPLEPCPCCGYCTLEERNESEICCVCWWEDDSTDNDQAMSFTEGPNEHVSLARGRINFLLAGIYDPERDDLLEIQEPAEKYLQGRRFVLDQEKHTIAEQNTDWSIPFLKVR